MPIKKAAFKAVRQDKKQAKRNLLTKLAVKDARRAFRKAMDRKEVNEAENSLKNAIKLLDKAYSRGIMKLNTVSRQKSRLMKKLQTLKKK